MGACKRSDHCRSDAVQRCLETQDGPCFSLWVNRIRTVVFHTAVEFGGDSFGKLIVTASESIRDLSLAKARDSRAVAPRAFRLPTSPSVARMI